MAGPVPPPGSDRPVSAAPAPKGGDGPLYLEDASFAWSRSTESDATYAWSCRVRNPSHEEFRVTVVVALLDRSGREVATDSQAFTLEGGDEYLAEGGTSLGADDVSKVERWRIEYWVRVPRRPLRY